MVSNIQPTIQLRGVVADVLSEAAPEELLLLDDFDPSSSRNGKAGSGPLGIGLEAAAALVLPVVWKVAESLLEDLWSEARKEGIKALVRAAMARLNGSGRSSTEPSPELIKEVARRLEAEDIDPAKVSGLAAAIATAVLKHHAGSQQRG